MYLSDRQFNTPPLFLKETSYIHLEIRLKYTPQHEKTKKKTNAALEGA
jgi:hypothetical protein